MCTPRAPAFPTTSLVRGGRAVVVSTQHVAASWTVQYTCTVGSRASGWFGSGRGSTLHTTIDKAPSRVVEFWRSRLTPVLLSMTSCRLEKPSHACVPPTHVPFFGFCCTKIAPKDKPKNLPSSSVLFSAASWRRNGRRGGPTHHRTHATTTIQYYTRALTAVGQ